MCMLRPREICQAVHEIRCQIHPCAGVVVYISVLPAGPSPATPERFVCPPKAH
ncbi:hypothetical protein FOMPIDRAFT_1021743, partial [Fomitopsis schrenkii]